MREEEILARLKSAVDQAPKDIYPSIQEELGKEDTKRKGDKKNKGPLEEKIIPLSRYLTGLVIAACLVLAVSLGTDYYRNMPIGEIYLDINPSFSVEIKRNDKVKDIHPLNADAFAIVDGVSFEDMTYDEAMLELVRLAEREGYLEEDINLVILSSSTDMGSRLDASATSLVKAYEDEPTELTVLKQDLGQDSDQASGYLALLSRIADKEGISLTYMQALELEELLAYLEEEGVNIRDYVEVDGRLPKPKKIKETEESEELEESEETESTEVSSPAEPSQTEAQPVPAPPAQPQPVYDDDDDWDDDDDDWDDDNWVDDYDDDYDDDWDDGGDDWDDDDDDDDD